MSRGRWGVAALAGLVAIALLRWAGTGPAAPPPPGGPRAEEEPAPRPLRREPRPVAPPPVAAGAPSGLRVRIVDEGGRPDPAAWAEAVDCPALRAGASTEPTVLAYAVDPGPCALRAVRADGLARTEGPITTVEVPPGEVVEVELGLSSVRTGGVQLAFQPTDEGVRVMWVPPDSDLDRAGVARGDALVAVGGRALAGLDPADVRALLAGPEGAEVQLEVLRAGDDTGAGPELLTLRHTLVEPP